MRVSAASLAVVIPSFQRLERLPALVEEYARQGADEIVVVLDGPHPGWESMLPPRPPLRVVELPENVGLALARIAGLRAVASDIILAVDDDVEPCPGLVERHRRFHADILRDVVLQGICPLCSQRDEAATTRLRTCTRVTTRSRRMYGDMAVPRLF